MPNKPRAPGTPAQMPKSLRRRARPLDLPRGMRDFGAEDEAGIEQVRSAFLRTASLYGFEHVEPSPIESIQALEAKSGPAIRDEIYHFQDKGGRDVGLRFDLTVGMTRRIAASKSAPLPAKMSSFGGVYRYDEPQKGRYRYFHQWDVEIYGRPSSESDAEVIELTSRLLDSLRLRGVTIEVSHRGLVESRVSQIIGSDDPAKVSDMLRAMDKSSKKPRDEILREFEEYGADAVGAVLDLAAMRGPLDDVRGSVAPGSPAWDELAGVFASLENRGVTNAVVNLGIVRGLDYYTGIVFEAFAEGSGVGALAGGGRYDSLPGAFGRGDIGAAGAAGGVERIVLAMRAQGADGPRGPGRVSVVYASPEMQKVAVSITSMLRLAGIHADVDLAGRGMRKQMERAGSSRLAVIVGPDELREGNVLLRDMAAGTEGTVPLERLSEDPRAVLSS